MTIPDKQFAVSDARRLCRSLLDAVNDVVFIFEPGSSRVLAANKSACKVYGYTKKEIVGKHLQMLTHDTTNYLPFVPLVTRYARVLWIYFDRWAWPSRPGAAD